MYVVTAEKTGKFEIYNQRRKKVVFKGTDRMMKAKAGTSYEFASCDDMLATLCKWVSISTFRKVTRMLRP
ncbi:MAG: hypothetical protein ACWGQW_03275 [bacterium]